MIWLAVAAGGAIGTLARHGVNIFFTHLVGRAVPYATAVVNIAGALAVGLLSGAIASGRLELSNEMRTFIFVGILGGFTTFSSFMLDTLTLGHGGEQARAFSNVAVQMVFGLAAVWAGFRVGSLTN